MKKIINNPQNVVMEMCNGIVLAHPDLELISKYKIIKRRKQNKEKVTLISGGGSGHEPAHAGFVGKGLLDAAVCGDVFASPSQIQVYQAIRETAGDKGTLLIIKNYSGDMMNFKNAAYLAQEDGIPVDYIKVDDDIAVTDSLYTIGKRGVAGTVFVHKIAGAAAEKGMDLAQVKRLAEKTVSNVKSIGFAFTSCTVPAKGTPTFILDDDEMEYGVGIHGEPGIRREKLVTADELAKKMTDALLNELQPDPGQEIALLVNGFGGTPAQELYLLNHSVNKELAKHPVVVSHTLVGSYMTSIDMAGASLSILKLDPELKDLLTAPCCAPVFTITDWPANTPYTSVEDDSMTDLNASYQIQTNADCAVIHNNCISLDNLIYMVDCMSESVIRNEVPFCELDSHAGDGDFGMSIAKGFRRLKEEWSEIMAYHTDTIGDFLDACSLVIMEHCGGASGPIWGSAFRAAGKYAGAKKELSISEFAQMLQSSIKGIQATGERSFGRGAEIGDKTLIDAFIPCANTWSLCAKAGEDVLTTLIRAARAAEDGARATEKIVARMGRAGTVGERSLGYPDAGAYGLGVIFRDVAEAMKVSD
ncbi:MAG: dihydroxyacetone kinase subunit DhaK [Clostridiales bacterium]|nr:dihydroxyacetone kinase subunit DhaK [Clostridiales bacterium]MDU3239058.1 dihydroxyacetone kinase subunit DhaK [Clostridiales bacterium]